MKSNRWIIVVAALAAACLSPRDEPRRETALEGPNGHFWVKLTSSMSTETSKPGDAVTAVVMVHETMQGALLEGEVEMAERPVLRFSFHTLTFEGETWRIDDYLMSITNSKGWAGRDDLDQRIRVDGDGGGFIAYGKTTALNEGAEIKFAAWTPQQSNAAVAEAAPRSMVDEIVARIESPAIPARQFDVTDFGAVPDDSRDDRPAILSAVAAAFDAGGGRVMLPPGVWYSAGPIVLRSRIELHVGDGATLLFSPHADDYLPVVRTRWEGTMMMGYSPLIYAAEVEDVAITGEGLIDGNADSEFHAWNSDAREPRLPAAAIRRLRRMGMDGVPVEDRVFGAGSYLRPSAIQFLGARRVLLEDYTIRNSPFWVNHLVFTKQATMRGVRVDSHRGNNDGIDVDSSSYVLIEDNHFRTGDDSVVVKSGRDRDGRDIGVPSEYVVVRNNDMGGEDGIAIGSEMSGDVRFVFFDNNVLRSGSSAIRFKASLDRGGVVEHVRVRNFDVEVFDTLFWFQLVRGDETDGRFPGTYRDIVFEDFRAEKVDRLLVVSAPAAAPLTDVTIRNVAVGEAGQVLDIENAEGLTFDNVTVGGQRIDGAMSWRAE